MSDATPSRRITHLGTGLAFGYSLGMTSAFSTAAPAFDAFLSIAKDARSSPGTGEINSQNIRFVPRNFLLDERIDSERVTHYVEGIPATGPMSFAEWNIVHNSYLERRVFVKPAATRDYRSVATDDISACPETFRAGLALSAFQETDFDTEFIRLTTVADLAWLSGRDENEIHALGAQVVSSGNDSAAPAWTDLAAIFDEAYHGPKCDHRPMFAGFYEDFIDELRDPANSSWPDALRNRLGLYHVSKQRVFLFRYPVRELPRKRNDASRRPIAVPSVLDHRWAEAFCPAPKELRQGQILNLDINSRMQPAREVLHLFMPMEPKHLFRVGTVRTSVPPSLSLARRDHLLWMRLLSEREDYAAATDGDLFPS